MNKNFALILSCAVSILGLASCNNKEADILKSNDKTHTVVFQAQNPAAPETKTALRLEVVPDWRETDVKDVHIFETETIGESVTTKEAKSVKMEIVDEKNKEALFTAEFPNAEIIVNPPSATTKASTSSTYQYTAIMATREGDKYVVPSVQYPHDEAWIDPKADMLVGSNETIFSSYQDNQELGLQFARPVALARLAITNLEGEKVEKVKITTVNNITGYLTYADVDFKNKKKQTFKSDDSDKVLTLLYPDGKNLTTTFYAYFVCVPQKIQFSKIEVFTDEYVFTKTYSTSTPPSLTFTAGDFMNIALDMTPKDNNGVTRTGLGEQTLTFVDDDENAVTAIEFDLVNGKDKFVAPTLVIGDNVVDKTAVTITSNNEEVATVDDEGKVSLTGATGEVTITAAVPGDETHAAGYASYTITVTDTTAPETVTFYKAEEIEAGKEYVIVSGGKALTADLGAQDVTIENDTFEAEPDKYTLWTAAARVAYYEGTSAAGHFTLENGDNYLQRKSNQSEQTLIVGAEPSNGKYYVWDYDGQHLDHLTLGNNTLYHYCVNYDDGWVVTSVADANNATYPTTVLYSTSKPRTKQVISFGEDPVTAKYDLNGGQWTVNVPKLTGAQTTVTYESSNTAVATVDATSGDVTIAASAKKGDKATITATAEKTAEYTSATASYTIEIIDSTPVPTAVYNKVTSVDELEEDGQYLLVFEGLAGDTDGDGNPKVFNPVLSSDGNTFAKAQSSALDVAISNSAIESADFEDCLFTLEDGYYLKANKAAKYIYPNSTSSSFSTSYIMGAEATASHALSISFSSGIAEIKNGSQYLVWSTSSHYFSCNSAVSGTSSTGICLYKLDDGRQPRSIEFSATTAEFDLANTSAFVKPTLTVGGDATTVTFTSSNTAIAEVDNSGNITAHKKGEVTITAKAARTDTYKAASASYKLTVVNSDEKPSAYNKVTSTDDLEAGATYVIGNTNGTKIFKPELNGSDFKDTENTVDVTVTNGVITSADLDDCQVTIDVLSSGYSIYVPATDTYLYLTSGKMGSEKPASDSHYSSITVNSNGSVTIKRGGNNNYYLRYSSSNDKFYENSTSSELALYKLDDGQPKKRNLAFSAESMSVNIYGKTTPYVLTGTPTISGKGLTDVTYSVSANTNIASVDSATGAVTLGGETGTVTITASADATDDYQAGEASYTLTVTNTAPPTYTKVDEITSGATYLIVSTDYNNYNSLGEKRAFAGDTSGSVVEVDGTSGTITGDFSACEFVITKEGDNYSLYGPNGYVTGQSNSDPYIQVSSSKVTMSLTDATTLKAASSGDGLVSDAFYFYYTKTSNTGTSTEVLYLNSNGKFKIGGSGRKYGVHLYKKN